MLFIKTKVCKSNCVVEKLRHAQFAFTQNIESKLPIFRLKGIGYFVGYFNLNIKIV